MNPSLPTDQVVIDNPPLFLPIDDRTLLSVMQEAERRAQQKYSEGGYGDKSQDNQKFWMGEQVDEAKLDQRYQMAHVDNVSFQDLESQIKMASSKMPDIFCAPPDEEDYNMESARNIQEWIRERIDTGTIKRLIKNGLRSMNLNYIGIIKPRWDYASNDFTFELIDPKDMRFSEGSKIVEDGFTIDGTDITFQYVEEPTTVVLAKFKKKAQALQTEIGIQNKGQIPSRIRYTECQFRWFDDKGRMNEGVCWRYGNLILDSMKQPYYDYDNPQVNYFDRPRKGYILFSYLNLGNSVYEATTTFDQGKPLNKVINKRRRQITEISDRAVPKLAFSGGALTKAQAQNISPSPQEGILLNDEIDDIRKAMFIIPATPPNPILYSDLSDLRGRMDSLYSTHGTSRGESIGMAGGASGTSKQITREGDLITSDDIVSIVIERVVTEMAQWAMQFARLFYDEDRAPLRITNEEGDTRFANMDRDTIETDVQIIVKGSTNDKQTRRSDALQMLTGKVTDPYTLFEDLDVPNPKERTRRLMSFIQAQQSGDWQKYLDMIGVDLETNKADQGDAQKDIEVLLQGGNPPSTRKPSESYVSTFLSFVNSSDFGALDEQGRQRIQQWVQVMKQNAAAQGGQPQNPQQPQNAQQALQGAPTDPNLPPGFDPSQQYGPSVDTNTVFTDPSAGSSNNAAQRQASMQGRTFFPVSSAPLRQA